MTQRKLISRRQEFTIGGTRLLCEYILTKDGDRSASVRFWLLDPKGNKGPESDVLGFLKQTSQCGWYRADHFGWVLADDVVVLPEPVECRGAQGLWKVKPSVAEKVLAQLRGLNNASNH